MASGSLQILCHSTIFYAERCDWSVQTSSNDKASIMMYLFNSLRSLQTRAAWLKMRSRVCWLWARASEQSMLLWRLPICHLMKTYKQNLIPNWKPFNANCELQSLPPWTIFWSAFHFPAVQTTYLKRILTFFHNIVSNKKQHNCNMATIEL